MYVSRDNISRDNISRDVFYHAYLHMEQHVEEITSCCHEFVIGGSEKEPVRALARGLLVMLLVGVN